MKNGDFEIFLFVSILKGNSVHFYNSANPVIQQHLLQAAVANHVMPNVYSATQRRRHPAGDQNQSQQQHQQQTQVKIFLFTLGTFF